jgi:type II secretory pathway pseudopilin PulG
MSRGSFRSGREHNGEVPRATGVTLLELVVAMAITLVVGSAVVLLLGPVHDAFRRESEANDARQRMRVAADVLRTGLRAAGAGVYGTDDRGPLVQWLPPVLPRRLGRWSPDPPTTAFSDRVTILGIPGTGLQAPLASGMSARGAPVEVDTDSGCPVARAACGFTPGTQALVFDRTRAWDLMVVTDVTGNALGHWPARLSKAYEPAGDAQVVAVEMQVLYHDASRRQLRRYDGNQSDLPVVDEVVELELRYLVDPAPPRSPPPPGVPDATCVTRADGSPILPALGPTPAPLVELPPSAFADGPFCGEPANRWDADLLRVRAVRVWLRVQARDPAVRGSHPLLFVNPGHASRSRLLVPDLGWDFQVAPRNMNFGR